MLGWKAVGLFQEGPKVGRPEEVFENYTEGKQSLWLGDGVQTRL